MMAYTMLSASQQQSSKMWCYLNAVLFIVDVFISTVPGLVLLSIGQFTSKAVDPTIEYKKRKHSMWILKPSSNFSLTVSVSVSVCLSLSLSLSRSLCELYKIIRVLKKRKFQLKCSRHLIEVGEVGGWGCRMVSHNK